MSADVSFGEQLEALRKTASLTQEAVAAAIGCSRQFVAAVERGTKRLPPDKLPDLAAVLGVKVSELEARSGQVPEDVMAFLRRPAVVRLVRVVAGKYSDGEIVRMAKELAR